MLKKITKTLSWLWIEFWPAALAAVFFYVIALIAFWIPSTTDTEFAGVLAAGAAIGSSLLTGASFQYTQNRKYNRETAALKVGIVEELIGTLRFVIAGSQQAKSTSYKYYYSKMTVAQVNTGFPIYNRAAGSLAITGSDFTASAITAYTILSSSFDPTKPTFIWHSNLALPFIGALHQCVLRAQTGTMMSDFSLL